MRRPKSSPSTRMHKTTCFIGAVAERSAVRILATLYSVVILYPSLLFSFVQNPLPCLRFQNNSYNRNERPIRLPGVQSISSTEAVPLNLINTSAVLFVIVILYRLGVFSMCFNCCVSLCRAKPRSASRERIHTRSGSTDPEDDRRTSRSSSKKSSASLRRRSSSASDLGKVPSSMIMSRSDPNMVPNWGASITGFALPPGEGMPEGTYVSPAAQALVQAQNRVNAGFRGSVYGQNEGFRPSAYGQFGSMAGQPFNQGMSGFHPGGYGNPSFGANRGFGEGGQGDGFGNRFPNGGSLSPTSRAVAQSAFTPGYQPGFGAPGPNGRPGGYTVGSTFSPGHGSAFSPGQGSPFSPGQGSPFSPGQGSPFAPGQGSPLSLGQFTPGSAFPPSPTERVGGASVVQNGFGNPMQRAASVYQMGGQNQQARAPPMVSEMTQEMVVQAAGTGTIVYLNFEVRRVCFFRS